VKIIDFGLAVEMANPRMADETYIEGTLHYLSPEQAESKPLDGRSDIYSLGVTLYEMLCATRPFEGRTASSIMRKHLDWRRPSLPVKETGTPSALQAILQKMLARYPEDRYPDAKAVTEELSRYLKRPPFGQRRNPT